MDPTIPPLSCYLERGFIVTEILELPEVLANQIAAGEVVERPSSVVKELLENAIDAGSQSIEIRLQEAGLKLIEIRDDGRGIAFGELSLALKRHATSKIKRQADLFRIRTLGFRGEALPSIASVSRLTLESQEAGAHKGQRLVTQAGEILEEETISRAQGTTVRVADLFYNTPARLKYMRSPQSELSHVVDVVNRLSLAHPSISFTLIHEDKQLLQTSGQGDLRQVLAAIYGLTTARKMVEVEAHDLDISVHGYVSLPELTRANRSYITLLVNGRYIKNFLLNRAILEGYGSKLMVGRFPLVVLDIELDPFLADVNVHPTKQELRLSKEKEVMDLIRQAIQEALKEQDLIPDALENLAKSAVQKVNKPVQTSLVLEENPIYFQVPSQEEAQGSTPGVVVEEAPPASNSVHFAQRQEADYGDLDHPELDLASLEKAYGKLEGEETATFPQLEYFGQMHGTYLFAQGKEGLYIVDQHAAQERVKYEEYRQSIGEVSGDQQQLLVPYIFEFSAGDALRIKEQLPVLAEVGVHLSDYGNNQFILREHPIWFKEEEIEAGVYEMCDMLLMTKEVSIHKYRAELAIMMSCKRSIKANHALDEHSARHLLYQLRLCQNPYNCPHGRPVLVHFTNRDMEKMFRRIQENHKSLREFGKYE
nr:DNA mismatch repair endonuclease MutL [Streptococcus sp. NLN64]